MKKYLIFISVSLVCLGAIFISQYNSFYDRRLHIIFCNVGQGNAVLIKTNRNKNILIDAGPDKSSLNCLNDHLSFWDKKIDLMLLSSPEKDNLTGMYFIIERYDVLSFATFSMVNNTGLYQNLLKTLSSHKIKRRTVSAGDKFKFGDNLVLSVESPAGKSSARDSLVLKLTYNSFDVLLTGSADKKILADVSARLQSKIEVLQVPNYGSSSGLNKNILQLLSPKLAIISVGFNNPYGYPQGEVLKFLAQAGTKTLRTDRVGDIEIISDGKAFWVK